MQAIVETGGKQYRVTSGDVIRVSKLAGESGSEVELKPLVIFNDEGGMVAGADLGEARVKATILNSGRGKKILVFKFKRKKQYKKTIGHRQDYTEVQVGDIVM